MLFLRMILLAGLIICGACVASNAQSAVRIDLVHPPSGTTFRAAPAPLLEPNAATKCYGFFCRQELKGDKVLPVPVRMRLGSMQQNDWLEQKANATAPVR